MNEEGVLMPTGKYCVNHAETVRRKTRTVNVGNVKIGSEHPIVKQTMTTSDTRDVEATVAEVIRCADAGAEMVRITVQGMQEAKACKEIKETLVARGYDTPLIADIHFAPKVAMMVAECFDKIRVNRVTLRMDVRSSKTSYTRRTRNTTPSSRRLKRSSRLSF